VRLTTLELAIAFLDALQKLRTRRRYNSWNSSLAAAHYMSDVDDGTLLARARRGEEEAFSLLFARHQRAVYRYAAYICGRDGADDVVQDTFLAILRQRERIDVPRTALQAYLLGIARRVALKRLTLQGAYEEIQLETLNVEDAVASSQLTTLDALTHREGTEFVRAAVNSLPLAYREVISLCDLQELDYASAADVLQVPIGTVRSRLHRARALLAVKLSKGYQPAPPQDRQER
jgi:RNA polymerase sigma-70 factor (ECF subfamily)